MNLLKLFKQEQPEKETMNEKEQISFDNPILEELMSRNFEIQASFTKDKQGEWEINTALKVER